MKPKGRKSRRPQPEPSQAPVTPPDPPASIGRCALVTLAVLIPCFWQSRVQAGDLGSHIYNAWLADWIASGHGPGLAVVFQPTNILFDWLLSALLPLLGATATQRAAVAIAVVIFVGGAFAFVSVVGGRRPWGLLPVIAMLAYGWVFHAGFFNFHLSLGLCFCALALAWNRRPRGVAAAVALLALAILGHVLPVVWAIAILAYAWIGGRLRAGARARLLGASLAGLLVLHLAIRLAANSQWYWSQTLLITGADQAHVFDDKYYVASIAVALIFGVLLVQLAAREGRRTLLASIPFQIWLLCAAAVAAIPTAIAGRGAPAAFISDRMSLPAGIALCALLTPAASGRFARYAALAAAALFFGLLYRDERILNAFEDQLEAVVAHGLANQPPHPRIVDTVDDPDLHAGALTHMIDRVCLGRCYSYANYEPSTGQFRVRVRGENPLVAATYEDSWRMQNGSYVVKERDLPLSAVRVDGSGRLWLQSLSAGERIGAAYWRALPDLF